MNESYPETVLEGRLERIAYHDETSRFTVARFKPENSEGLITVIGTLPDPSPREMLRIRGNWETHARYGEQFRILSAELLLPATVEGIKEYLQSGCIKGVGPKTAERLVRHFREETLEVIETAPHRLAEVKGIGPSNAECIASAWKNHRALFHLMQFLQECGVVGPVCARIYERYGADALNIIQKDPYLLAQDFPKIGYPIADAVARHMGLPADDRRRVQFCVLNILQQAVEEGHTFFYSDALLNRCGRFEVSEGSFDQALEELSENREVAFVQNGDRTAVYLKPLHDAEENIARRLLAMLSLPVPPPDLDSESIAEAVLCRLALRLSEEQETVLKGVLDHRVAVITGGPGTGKTTLIRALTALLEQRGEQILLAAPTGRAARRIGELTGKKAETVHKILKFNLQAGRFEKNQADPLTADTIIVDEASMIDTLLMHHLLQAVHLRSRLILVGDVFQLPSVGPGNVLSDLIRSDRIQTYTLKEIFRQARQSPIISGAHRVREGLQPDWDSNGEYLSECSFIEEDRPERIVEILIDLCTRQIPDRYGLDAFTDIQVVTPMHKGRVGTVHLNRVLQEALNPEKMKNDKPIGSFRIGDKVMHLKNDYRKEIFNGDIGIVSAFDPRRETLEVDFDGRIVPYDFSELGALSLAYAISVHKSQGSEYPAVILPLHTQHYPLLQRNLLYTAISRGKRLVVVIGTRRAVAVALNNDRPHDRLSGLAKRLTGKR